MLRDLVARTAASRKKEVFPARVARPWSWPTAPSQSSKMLDAPGVVHRFAFMKRKEDISSELALNRRYHIPSPRRRYPKKMVTRLKSSVRCLPNAELHLLSCVCMMNECVSDEGQVIT